MSSEPRNPLWRKQSFDRLRSEIRDELDSVGPVGGPERKRLHHAIQRVIDCAKEGSQDSHVKQYIYAMFALVEHCKEGGLKEQDKSHLLKLVEKILKIHRVPWRDNRHAFLHGDLYLVKSQIHRFEGKHVEALWEEQIATYLSQKASENRTSFQKLSIAIHLLRMGFAKLAYHELISINPSDLNSDSRWRWIHEVHNCLRLSYQLDKAKDFYEQHNSWMAEQGGDHFREWEWEGVCRQAQETGRIDIAMRLCLPRKKFGEAPFTLEAFFLARVIRKKNWMERFTSLPSTRFELGTNHYHWEAFWKTAQVFKEAYGQKTDYVFRLKALGDVLSRVSQYRPVYHELLVRGALVRWLLRRPTHVFEKVAIGEYQTLCFRLTNGAHHDVLNLLPDVPRLDKIDENPVAVAEETESDESEEAA